MTPVYELQGNIHNSIKIDGDLLFPNVQTCVAVVAVNGGSMAGAHVTLADRTRLHEVAAALEAAVGGTPSIYAVGPVDGVYELTGLGGHVHAFNTPGFLEVRAVLNGSLEFFVRPIDGDAWQRLDTTLFS